MRRIRIGIVGGGLGGLTAALALRATGQEVVVFEQAAVFRPVGAGISLWPNGVKVLSQLGLGSHLAAAAGRMDRMAYASSDGRTLTDFSLEPLYATVGERARPLARSALQDLLIDAVGEEHIHVGRRCTGAESDDHTAVAHFSDGYDFEGDVVVGADGTHSLLRSLVAGRPVERCYVGYVNFNTILPASSAPTAPGTWVTWVGEGRRASVMPCGKAAVYSFFDIPMSLRDGLDPKLSPREELAQAFGGWAPPVRTVMDAIDHSKLNRVLIHDLPAVPAWFRDRMVLLGDAAHSMAPDLGQGGCQAMEDALVLARYLASAGRSLTDALRRYQDERAPRTREIVRRARKRSDLTHAVDREATEGWYRSLEGDTGEQIIAGLVESVVTGPCR